MKKILLSAFVIFSFIAYSIHQRTEGSEVQVIAPTSLQPTPTVSDQLIISTPVPTSPPGNGMSNGTMGSGGMMMGLYRNGVYTGTVEDVFYGNIQVQAVISGGKITDVIFLQHPNDRQTSILINSQAMPFLKQEAIQAQSAAVDIISGATDSSYGFRKSLAEALAQAK